MSKIKIALVEGDSFWREILIRELRAEPDFTVVEAAASREQGQQLLKQRQFDVLLLNLMLTPPDYDGLDLAREALGQNAVKIILLASADDAEWIGSAIQAGVMNIVLKSCYRELPSAIREAYQDHKFIHIHALQQLRREISRLKRIEGEWALTRSEREVLQLIGLGYTRREVMQALHVSENTVKSHVFRLTKKFNVKSGKEAAMVAKRKGWFS
ncbi:response regulator transcription factor [Paenibacillus sp. S150]|uniref:response regulator transcription factor n=1 Tax=Paenibacillus sp. S150 TaxID=2749826 RepID=UPI001C56D948|nr:response regulator transcription factor [Paenibacillus sp. S150]MBW4081279.1 response regulator transcription factor [Paenibacillus sp. S150]